MNLNKFNFSFQNFLIKIILISLLLINTNSINITLEEAKQKSPIPFIESFCDSKRLEFYNFDRRDCREHYDKGYDCGEGLEINNSGMKWYYDNKHYLCMPFGYKGCGGNGNRFISKDQCYSNKCPHPSIFF